MKLLLAFLFVFIVFESSAQECKAYLPYQEGTTWELTNYDAKGKETGRISYKLTELKESGGATNFTVDLSSFDKKDNEVYAGSYEAQCKDGKFTFDMSSMLGSTSMSGSSAEMKMDASELDLPDMDTKPGTALKDGTMTAEMTSTGTGLLKMTMSVTNREVVGKEQKETPAGSFECLVISQKVLTKMIINIEMSTKEWYAEGVGLVASESFNKKGKLIGSTQLTKFDK